MKGLILALSLCLAGIARTEAPVKEIPLPAPRLEGTLSIEEAIRLRRSVRDYAKTPLALGDVSQLLWAAQGVTEPARGFRAAPSAGATYPLEMYLVAGSVEGLKPGIYRYLPGKHVLLRVVSGDVRENLCSASLGQPWVGKAPATIAIAAVYSRTASRYGRRARRYVEIEVGHASENIYLQAESLGIGTVAVGAFDDGAVRSVLGLKGEEVPLYLMPVGKKSGR